MGEYFRFSLLLLKYFVRPKLDSGLFIETKSLDSDSGQMRLSLELCCLDVSDVQTTLRNLGKDVPSYDVVQAFSKLKKAWPPKGHLIISVNAENEGGRHFFLIFIPC